MNYKIDSKTLIYLYLDCLIFLLLLYYIFAQINFLVSLQFLPNHTLCSCQTILLALFFFWLLSKYLCWGQNPRGESHQHDQVPLGPAGPVVTILLALAITFHNNQISIFDPKTAQTPQNQNFFQLTQLLSLPLSHRRQDTPKTKTQHCLSQNPQKLAPTLSPLLVQPPSTTWSEPLQPITI